MTWGTDAQKAQNAASCVFSLIAEKYIYSACHLTKTHMQCTNHSSVRIQQLWFRLYSTNQQSRCNVKHKQHSFTHHERLHSLCLWKILESVIMTCLSYFGNLCRGTQSSYLCLPPPSEQTHTMKANFPTPWCRDSVYAVWWVNNFYSHHTQVTHSCTAAKPLQINKLNIGIWLSLFLIAGSVWYAQVRLENDVVVHQWELNQLLSVSLIYV